MKSLPPYLFVRGQFLFIISCIFDSKQVVSLHYASVVSFS